MQIDQKDGNPEHRAEIRQIVEETVGEQLIDIIESSVFIGIWNLVYPHTIKFCDPLNNPADLNLVEYFADGTLITPLTDAKHPVRWEFQSGIYVEKHWCDPLPEYGIPDGVWESVRFHCATTSTKKIALWNGDSSLLKLLTPMVRVGD